MEGRIAGVWVHKSERLPKASEDPRDVEDHASVFVPVWYDNEFRMAQVILEDGWLAAGLWYDKQGDYCLDVEWWLDVTPPPKEIP